MKAMLCLLLAAGIAFGQTEEERFNTTLESSKVLAVKLFPGVTNPESDLVKEMVVADGVLKESGSGLFYSPRKPLILSAWANHNLWRSGDSATDVGDRFDKLSDAEKREAFLQLAYGYSDALSFTELPPGSAEEVSWKIGDPVPSTDLPGWMVLNGATLSNVEPDGITVAYEDGIRKIEFKDLPEMTRAKYGYDPEVAAEYSSEQHKMRVAAGQKMMDYQMALAESKIRSSVETREFNPPNTDEAPRPTRAGFNAFVEEQRSLSGGRKVSGKSGARYTEGPWKGLTAEGGFAQAERKWAAMTYQQKLWYEPTPRKAGAISGGNADILESEIEALKTEIDGLETAVAAGSTARDTKSQMQFVSDQEVLSAKKKVLAIKEEQLRSMR